MSFFVSLNPYWGIVEVPRVPCVNGPWRNWGGQILTLYLNYVVGYTDPLLFLFEQTQQLVTESQRVDEPRPPISAASCTLFCLDVLRVKFLLKTESGYLRDAGVT